MAVTIPAGDAARFAAYLQTPEYREQERDYKDAVHTVFRRLLSPETLSGPDGERRLGELFGTPMPHLDELGLPNADVLRVRTVLAPGGLKGAMVNLAGGFRAFATSQWIQDALRSGLTQPLTEALRALLDDSVDLASRVDAFIDDLRNLRTETERRTRLSSAITSDPMRLSFVAMLLAGYDRGRYTFYHFTALEAAYRQYGSAELRQSTPPGAKYADVCAFVRGVLQALRDHDVPAKDMIDAQSFIWLTRPGGPLDPTRADPVRETTVTTSASSWIAATEQEVDEIITGRRGQGLGLTADQRRAVEHRAMDEVKRHFEGWDVVPVYKTASYDLHATRGPEERHIEVKGTTAGPDTVLLT